MTWLYQGQEWNPDDLDPKILYGFVYLIENISNGKKYVGKKFLWSSKRKQVKGKRKRYLAESDWRDYNGSNSTLIEDIEQGNNIVKHILHLCGNKSECAYLEAREQFERRVLESEDYYNDWVSVRVRKANLKGIL